MRKRIWVITMFETYFEKFTDLGVIGQTFRGDRGGDISYELIPVSLPSFSPKGFKGVDGAPFGGGVGMIMRPDVLKDALIKGVVEAGEYDKEKFREELHIVCPAPRGKVWSHEVAVDFAKKNFSKESKKDLVFICGRYEGIDERFLESYVDEFISLGDYILTGGELAVMTILDSSLRFSDGILGNKLSSVEESFASGSLEHALYTRPREFEGVDVPEALSSGSHKRIAEFKEGSGNEMTNKYRKDLIKNKKDKI